jgi:hypothetical protein
MPGQLPGEGAVFLDHVAHFVPAMEPAAVALSACGFRLTPFSEQTNRVAGQTVAAGTGNRCAMLRRGYLEILVATGETPLAQQLRASLSRHIGLHLVAFSTGDAAAEHRRLAAAGFPVLPLVDMRRPVATESGQRDARFTIARVAPGAMPEGRVQFLTHHSESLVWRRDRLDHRNGAQALRALWVAAADPHEPAQRFARFTGRPARREGEIETIALDRGALHFAPPEFLAREFGLPLLPSLPGLAAYEIAVSDLQVAARLLTAAGLGLQPLEDGFAVVLPAALGGAIVFRQLSG